MIAQTYVFFIMSQIFNFKKDKKNVFSWNWFHEILIFNILCSRSQDDDKEGLIWRNFCPYVVSRFFKFTRRSKTPWHFVFRPWPKFTNPFVGYFEVPIAIEVDLAFEGEASADFNFHSCQLFGGIPNIFPSDSQSKSLLLALLFLFTVAFKKIYIHPNFDLVIKTIRPLLFTKSSFLLICFH